MRGTSQGDVCGVRERSGWNLTWSGGCGRGWAKKVPDEFSWHAVGGGRAGPRRQGGANRAGRNAVLCNDAFSPAVLIDTRLPVIVEDGIQSSMGNQAIRGILSLPVDHIKLAPTKSLASPASPAAAPPTVAPDASLPPLAASLPRP